MYRPPHDATSAAEHFHLSASSSSSPFPSFSSPVYGIDPALRSSPLLPHQVARHGVRLSPHLSHSTLGSAVSMEPRSVGTRAGSGSPRSSPGSNFKPTGRSLPSRDVTKANLTAAFVQFILYCNPNFPLDVDASTLMATFESPPKSDNKDFETFRLFELIKQLDAKEIKTWGQLALNLGVEAPDISKGQSVQKVQQYTVRLKRWMRAMHIDAFFEYLLGKQHIYFTEIPSPTDPYPANGRDGVPAEEDLAIRGLEPLFRPKRGRRRNSETADQDEHSGTEAKQPRLIESATPFQAAPTSAVPMSAPPDSLGDPWAAASAVASQNYAPWSGRSSSVLPSAASIAPHLRWQLGQSATPSTPNPMSAMSTSMSAHIDAAFENDPKSAVTPSTRKRRRHGPAVSSAWPSTNTPGAKPRGRPPANRNMQDGPYGTFPADPSYEKSRLQNSLPTPLTAEERPSIEQHSPRMAPPKPGRLSLQVPQHTGNPVRLATPPTLLVNGETNESESRSDSDDPTRHMLALASQQSQARTPPGDNRPPFLTFETLKRVLASDLLRAELIGRRRRLTGDEAKRLADSILDRFVVPRSDTPDPHDHLARVTAASWLGVGHHVKIPLGPSAGHDKRIAVTRFRAHPDGYEELVVDADTADHDPDPDSNAPDTLREVFDLSWRASQGGCIGVFEMKGLELASSSDDPESLHDLLLRKGAEALKYGASEAWVQASVREVARASASASASAATVGNDGIDWRSRYMAMEFAAKLAKGTVERERQILLDRVLDIVL